jgi:hypothetical protein
MLKNSTHKITTLVWAAAVTAIGLALGTPAGAATAAKPATATPVRTTATTSALTCPAGSWSADYFSNMTLIGTPAVSRCDAGINYDWGATGTPDPSMSHSNFSARWTQIQTFTAGSYRFTVTADDGVRVLLDGVAIINQWRDGAAATFSSTQSVLAGSHSVAVEYYQHGGAAMAKASVTNVTPPATCTAPSWVGDYYTNPNLTGTPTFSRCDAALNFDWSTASPDPAIATWGYSVRWTSTPTYTAGNYRFSVTADDGVRVLLDGTAIINQWHTENATTYNVMQTLTAGPHTVVVEYFNNTGAAIAKIAIVNVIDDSPKLTHLLLSDDFTGTALNSNWTIYNSQWSADPLANVPSLVSVNNGMLSLSTNGLSGSGVSMHAGAAATLPVYGRYDFRARMSAGASNGGVIMLWPNAENWPVGGEIDMAELSAADRQAADFVVHYGTDNRQILLTTQGDFTVWHSYSVEWTPTQIRYWVDGLLLSAITNTAAIPTGGMHLVAQVGPHGTGGSTAPSSTMDIDWIKVYN